MKNFLFLLVFLQTFFSYSQKIGIIESYNPHFKHAHLKGFINMKLFSVEDLNYNIKPFIDSLFIENKITAYKVENFDFKSYNSSNKLMEDIEKICEENNFETIIIIKNLGDKNNKNSVLATDLNPDLDFGIVSFENPKKSLFYYNNIVFLYYIRDNKKIEYPIRKKKESLFYELNPIKFDEIVFNPSDKTLLNKDKISNDFLIDLKNRLKLNFKQMIEDIEKHKLEK